MKVTVHICYNVSINAHYHCHFTYVALRNSSSASDRPLIIVVNPGTVDYMNLEQCAFFDLKYIHNNTRWNISQLSI